MRLNEKQVHYGKLLKTTLKIIVIDMAGWLAGWLAGCWLLAAGWLLAGWPIRFGEEYQQ